MNRCSFSAADLARIKRAVERVRAQVGVTEDVPRAALLRALLHRGLDLAETREITGASLIDGEAPTNIEFRIIASDGDRLTRLRRRLHAERPFSAFPALAKIERALILFALADVEMPAAFARFSRDVLASRIGRGDRGRS
jgi:hypothetical protein